MKRVVLFLLLIIMLIPVFTICAFGEEPAQQYIRYSPFEGEYLIDRYGLLTEEEQQAIEELAKQVSEQRECGIYVMIVEDYKELYKYRAIFKVNYTYYHEHNLGWGEERDGVMLLLSMKERDFSFFVYGDRAEHALNHYGQIQLENSFIGKLGRNLWYDGVRAFVSCCDRFLELAQEGTPVRRSATPGIVISAILSAFLGTILPAKMLSKNRKPEMKSEAMSYISKNLHITLSEDKFYDYSIIKHYDNTEYVSESESSTSTAHVGGGGSGRSGKF